MKASRLLTTACALLLLAAAAVQIRKMAQTPVTAGPLPLKAALPSAITGWQVRDLPLGSTEAADASVEKTLRFDEVYYREFRSARGTVSVYAAYWGPGKMPVQLVASHTPDRCWVENGWKSGAVKHGAGLGAGGTMLRPGEWRTFLAPDRELLNVQFWHLVGDETYDYGDRLNKVPSVWRWWRDAAKQVFQSPPQQYFVRLTSTRPFEELAGDPGWEELLQAFAKLGLKAPKPPRPET